MRAARGRKLTHIMERKKILFVAEAVTLAHLARPLALAQMLDRQRYAVHLACAPGHEAFLTGSDAQLSLIQSIPSAQFLAALAAGKPVYEEATLQAYVDEDLRLLSAVRPDVVVGDFRISLSVSARLANVPYVALSNAYWSPYVRQHYTVPSLPMSKLLPIPLANALFLAVRPLAFALHTRPLNKVRLHHGLPSLGYDLRRIYTDGDRTLYADIPEMFPAQAMPYSHSYLGPVMWSPPMELPEWWGAIPESRPVVYVTLGSSGQGALLPRVLAALASLPVTVIAATAGNAAPSPLPANARVANYLPGEAAARRASLVICNGGSPTSQQALAAGVPVLGIAGNLDQFLNMSGVVAAGAGILLRADRFDGDAVCAAAVKLIDSAEARSQAGRLGQLFRNYQPGSYLDAVLREMTGRAPEQKGGRPPLA